MWLLNTKTRELEWFVDERATKYAILSHTWGEDEMTFQDIQRGQREWKRGYRKIQRTCEQAKKDGYEYCWIDTCCINKESSAELSEAINSMFAWYGASDVCYALLEDIQHQHLDAIETATGTHVRFERSFGQARWFSRGWTLQELIAPRQVVFFDDEWYEIGSRNELCNLLAEVSNIDEAVLSGVGQDLSLYSVAAKMSWAANRQTTRREDRAYSLLGLFGINMPLLYGEGDHAFQRLQEEIIRRTTDQSFFAWHCDGSAKNVCALLAPSPDYFEGMSRVVRWRHGLKSSSQLTNQALEIKLPVVKIQGRIHDPELLLRKGWEPDDEYYAVLNCHHKDDLTGPLALCVWLPNEDHAKLFVRTHKTIDSTAYDRVRVMPRGVANDAVTRRWALHPRYHVHVHSDFEEPPSDLPGSIDKEVSMFMKKKRRDLWMQWTRHPSYSLEIVPSRLSGLQSSTGLFRNARSQLTYGSCTWRVQRKDYNSMHWRSVDDAPHFFTISAIFTRNGGRDISICLRDGDPEALSASNGSSSPFMEQESTEKASIELVEGIRINAEVKLDQEIMGYHVDTVTLSLEDKSRHADCQAGGSNGGAVYSVTPEQTILPLGED